MINRTCRALLAALVLAAPLLAGAPPAALAQSPSLDVPAAPRFVFLQEFESQGDRVFAYGGPASASPLTGQVSATSILVPEKKSRVGRLKLSLRVAQTFDCGQNRYRVDQADFVDENGKVIAAVTQNGDWQAAAPGAAATAAMQVVCGAVPVPDETYPDIKAVRADALKREAASTAR